MGHRVMESIESIESQHGVGQDAIQAILSGPDYFTCERTHTRLKKTDCVRRQTKGIKISNIGNSYEIPLECEGCRQGENIREEMKEMDAEKKTCSVKGCNETKFKARGMCKKHYDRWYMQEKAKHSGKKLGERGIDGRKGRKPLAAGEHTVLLNFEDHPELLQKLNTLAHDELRPVTMQIMYLVRKGLVDG